jgi:hypothetical protein
MGGSCCWELFDKLERCSDSLSSQLSTSPVSKFVKIFENEWSAFKECFFGYANYVCNNVRNPQLTVTTVRAGNEMFVFDGLPPFISSVILKLTRKGVGTRQ